MLRIVSVVGMISLLITAMGSAAVELNENKSGERVSLIQLISDPNRYDGKVVFLGAYAIVQFEGNSLCMQPRPASSKDCVWLQFDDGPWETKQDMVRYRRAAAKWRKFNGKRISVRGTFNQNNLGHFGGWSGAIEKISRVWLEK
jgi:hypothetical protein